MPKKTQTPSDLAAQLVQDWFDTFLSFETLNAADGLGDATFREVQDAVEREFVRDAGTPAAGDEIAPQMFAKEAGYLIGVQVGLRLRQATR